MCIKGADTFPRICLKVCGNWRYFQIYVSKVPTLFHEFASKCLEIGGVSKMCIEGAKTLQRICIKVFGNWRCFQRCVSKVPRIFHEFVLKCLEIECVSKECIKGRKTLPRNCLKRVELEGVFKDKYQRWHGVLIWLSWPLWMCKTLPWNFPILKSNVLFSIL